MDHGMDNGPQLNAWVTFGTLLFRSKSEDPTIVFSNPSKGIRREIVDSTGRIIDFPGIDEAKRDYIHWLVTYGFDEPVIHFRTDFSRMDDGRILMVWTLQPDGRYWADDDGFGAENDDEVTVYTFIDEEGRFTGPFRLYEVGVERYFSSDLEKGEIALREGRTEEAFKHFLAAAERRVVPAQYRVAECLMEGIGVDHDYREAFRWLERAVENGSADAMLMMADLCEKGIGVKKDIKRALELVRRASEHGSAEGEYRLGLYVRKGIGAKANLIYASNCFVSAAAKGHGPAQYELAMCYLEGCGRKADREKALELLGKAADQGVKAAQQKLMQLRNEQTNE